MAELSAFPRESGSEPLFYRRMSIPAIAGFAAGAFFAAMVLIEAAMGFRSGTPVLLNPILQAIPAAGIGLSLLALFRIGRSEGTLAGRGLALGGLWLNALVGLGYFAYYGATYVAIRQQADEFVVRWFQKLGQGKIIYAFLDTQPPALRRVNPEDLSEIEIRFNQPMRPPGTSVASAKGMLDIFRSHDYVKAISNSGSDIRVEPLGVTDWGFKNGAYRVERLYRVTTRDGVYEILVPAAGTTSEKHEFEGRQWNIAFVESKLKRTDASELAVKVQSLRLESSRFAYAWMEKIQGGKLTSAYLDTRRPEERTRLHSEFRRAGTAQSAAILAASLFPRMGGPAASCLGLAATGDFGFARGQYLPGYAARFERSEFVDTKKFFASDPSARESVLSAVQELLSAARGEPRVGQIEVDPDSGYQSWATDDEQRLIFPHDCRFLVVAKGFEAGNNHAYAAGAVITVESGPHALEGSKEKNWRILRFELVKAGETTLPGMNRLRKSPAKKGPGKVIPKAK
jgi:hypothetical protein